MSKQVPKFLRLTEDLSVEIKLHSRRAGELKSFDCRGYVARYGLTVDAEKYLAEKQAGAEHPPRKRRIQSAGEAVAGNVISVYGATNGKPEVWYYLLEQNFDGILLVKSGTYFFTTETIDPIESDTVLNWNVSAKIVKGGQIFISDTKQRSQERRLRLSLINVGK
jgi:hypothetical protein